MSIQNSNWAVQFLLNTDGFCTILNLKNPKPVRVILIMPIMGHAGHAVSTISASCGRCCQLSRLQAGSEWSGTE